MNIKYIKPTYIRSAYIPKNVAVQAMIWETPVATNDYINAWVEYKNRLTILEEKNEGETKAAHQIRGQMINCWNKMNPQHQKEIALRYCPES